MAAPAWPSAARRAALADPLCGAGCRTITCTAAWCREHGLYISQLDTWRQAFETVELSGGDDLRVQLRRERRKNGALHKELQRKERALAEAAALLTLSKKAQAIWGTDADD